MNLSFLSTEKLTTRNSTVWVPVFKVAPYLLVVAESNLKIHFPTNKGLTESVSGDKHTPSFDRQLTSSKTNSGAAGK